MKNVQFFYEKQEEPFLKKKKNYLYVPVEFRNPIHITSKNTWARVYLYPKFYHIEIIQV